MIKAGLSPSTRSALRPDIELDDLEIKLGELEAELTEINGNVELLTMSNSGTEAFNSFVKRSRVAEAP